MSSGWRSAYLTLTPIFCFCSSALAFNRFSSWAGENGYGHHPAPLTGHVLITVAEVFLDGLFRLVCGAVIVVDALMAPPLPTSVIPLIAQTAECRRKTP
jgi:hypothetical protein